MGFGNFNIGTLAVELQKQLRQGTRIADGEWTVSSDQEGRLTLNQSSPTASAKLYSGSDVRGQTPIPINWLFSTTDGAGSYVATSSSWLEAWSAVDIQESLPSGCDACSIIGLPYRLLEFSPSFQTQRTDHIDLARHRVLHLCSRELPQSSQTPHGRSDVVASLVCAGAAPGSIVHNSHSNPTVLHCHTRMEMQHLSFQVRDQADEIVDLSGHAVTFEICILRPTNEKILLYIKMATRKPGRPPGSKNRPKPVAIVEAVVEEVAEPVEEVLEELPTPSRKVPKPAPTPIKSRTKPKKPPPPESSESESEEHPHGKPVRPELPPSHPRNTPRKVRRARTPSESSEDPPPRKVRRARTPPSESSEPEPIPSRPIPIHYSAIYDELFHRDR